MRPRTARWLLFLTWFLFFLLQMGIVVFLYLDKWIEEDNFKAALQQVNASFAYLGVMITYLLSHKRERGAQGTTGVSFLVAMAGSLMFNGVLSAFLVRLLFKSGTIEDSIKQMALLGSLLSWLVAPAIGFYFATPTAANKEG